MVARSVLAGRLKTICYSGCGKVVLMDPSTCVQWMLSFRTVGAVDLYNWLSFNLEERNRDRERLLSIWACVKITDVVKHFLKTLHYTVMINFPSYWWLYCTNCDHSETWLSWSASVGLIPKSITRVSFCASVVELRGWGKGWGKGWGWGWELCCSGCWCHQ